MSNSLDLNQVSQMLFDLVEKNAGVAELSDFFLLLHHLGLKGLGIGGGGGVNESGEEYAIGYVRAALQKRYPEQPWILFDVGANVGGFLGKLAPAFAESPKRIFAFEPSPPTFDRLSQTVAARGLTDVALHNFGFSGKEATLDLFTDRAGSAIASLYQRRIDHFGAALNQREQVKLRTIDDFCVEQKIDRIHYLKMDVEGHELECLHGAANMLAAGAIDYIQFEFGGANIDSRVFFQDFWYLLKEYKIGRIMKDGVAWVRRYSEYEEVFLVQNYLAERRTD